MSAERRAAVLASGGLDSGVLLAELARGHEEVFPIYVRCGLPWEAAELDFLRDFLGALGEPRIRSVEVLSVPMDDVYGRAWYSSGEGIPGYAEPDEAWEIPGRNVILIAKAAVWCKLRGIPRIAIGTLAGNPFPDATAEFAARMSAALSSGLGAEIEVLRPLAGFTKADVIRLGRGLPLERTMSCARPAGRLHCGECGKCRERIEAFAAAGVPDPTAYAARVAGA